jgi:hypothetical protein
MDIGTLQGLLGAGIGILIFLMGYYKGTITGMKNTIDSMFAMGVLAVDEQNNVIAGPQINKLK